jgi:uncharacterized ferritin-like protein (DUF455 family)
LDAAWRFDGMPPSFHRDWVRVAAEEAFHFSLLREHLSSLGHSYGDFPAHDNLWVMCDKTREDIVARMAPSTANAESARPGRDAADPGEAAQGRNAGSAAGCGHPGRHPAR